MARPRLVPRGSRRRVSSEPHVPQCTAVQQAGPGLEGMIGERQEGSGVRLLLGEREPLERFGLGGGEPCREHSKR